MYKFLLADDHTVVRTGLKLLINESFRDSEIHEASNGDEVITKIKHDKFDLIIMDIRMPGTEALDVVEFIRLRHEDVKILIFSISPEEIYASRFLKLGANGYISKDATLEELQKAIQQVINGKTYLSEKLMEKLAHDSFSNKSINPFNNLSTREFEVASKILSGLCLNDIARSLNLSQSTVGTHKARVLEKLNISNVFQLKDLANLYRIV
jgi:two-component system invasion response regulator UvrY